LIASATGRSYAAGPHGDRGESEWRRCTSGVHQPIDDAKYILVELDFDSAEQAEAFKSFLETNVWSNPEASPGLDGAPRARVLTEVVSG
jgi:hypothetical protein